MKGLHWLRVIVFCAADEARGSGRLAIPWLYQKRRTYHLSEEFQRSLFARQFRRSLIPLSIRRRKQIREGGSRQIVPDAGAVLNRPS
jgi:hypothetical protein